MEDKYCQSCGMPLTSANLGTNKDGSKNEDYCEYCYKDGAFTSECSMEEMIEFCIQPMVDEIPGMTAEKAKADMQAYFPTLKRWMK